MSIYVRTSALSNGTLPSAENLNTDSRYTGTKFLVLRQNNKNLYTPLVEGTATKSCLNTKFKVGDTYYYFSNIRRGLRVRLNGKNYSTCNQTGTVAVDDTFSWSTTEVNEDSTNFDVTIVGKGNLTITLTLYDANNNEITDTSNLWDCNLFVYINGVLNFRKSDFRLKPHTTFEVNCRSVNSDGTRGEFYYYYDGTKIDDTGFTLPVRFSYVIDDVDSRVAKIKADYTWTWK